MYRTEKIAKKYIESEYGEKVKYSHDEVPDFVLSKSGIEFEVKSVDARINDKVGFKLGQLKKWETHHTINIIMVDRIKEVPIMQFKIMDVVDLREEEPDDKNNNSNR